MNKDKHGSFIFRASFIDKNGIKRYAKSAKSYGKRAFKIYVTGPLKGKLANALN